MKKNRGLRNYKLVLSSMIIASMLVHGLILWNSKSYIASGQTDFLIFYAGAQILFAGRAGDLYDPDVQRLYQQKIAAPTPEWNLPFNHAPYELLLFWPLCYLPFPAAHFLWGIVNLVLLGFVYWYLAPFIDPNHRLLLGALLFASYPTMVTVQMGQDSILTLCILVMVFVSLKNQRDGLAGILLACGLYKPQLVLPMAGLFIVDKRWRALLTFATTMVCLAAISLVMAGVHGIADYVSLLQYHDYVIYPQNMSNIRGLFHIAFNGFFSERQVALSVIVTSILLYGGCLTMCRQKSGARDSRLDLRFSLICITTVLVSYHLYAHDLLLLMAPVMLMSSYALRGQTRIAAARLIVLALIPIFSIPLLPVLVSRNRQLAWGTLLFVIFGFAVSLELYASRTVATVKERAQ